MIPNKWHKFYTPASLAKNVISLIPDIPNPKMAADICAGSGKFLEAVRTRWRTPHLLAIDKDSCAVKRLSNDMTNTQTKCLDVVQMQGVARFLRQNPQYHMGCDIVVANPPFGRHKIDRDVWQTTIMHMGNDRLQHISSLAFPLARLEAFMLISNLLFLKPGGIFAAVVPENLFSGETWQQFRDFLMSDILETIHIGAATKSFGGSEVLTRQYIGKLRPENKISVLSNKRISPNTNNVKIEIIRGPHIPIRTDLPRGNNSVPAFHLDHLTVLHSEIGKLQHTRFIERETPDFKSTAQLRKGDIVIARVGRSYGKAICVKSKCVGWHVTDCVYILRNSNIYKEKLCSLTSMLRNARKGLTASYITHRDIIAAVNKLTANISN